MRPQNRQPLQVALVFRYPQALPSLNTQRVRYGYLKCLSSIYRQVILCISKEGDRPLASVMGVVPGTVTTMVKALADSGLVTYEPRGGVRLTRGGEQLALHVLRRHRLVELFLVKVVGLDWSEVHAEADELEHAISDKVLERIDQ